MTAEQIVQQYGRNVRTKKDGWLLSCLNPAHDDRTPSLSIRLDGLFLCWSCGWRGNLSTLLHDVCNWSWARATAHAKLTETCTPKPVLLSPEWRKTHGSVNITISRGLLGLYAVDWDGGYKKYKAAKANDDDNFPAWCFPFMKGFTPETLNHFEAGYDKSFDRVTIPISNLAGQLVGFIGRTCIGDDQKYMVYPPLLPSHHVYGLDRAAGHRGDVLIVEGPWDVWALHQIDPSLRAVAVMTSRLLTAQVDHLVKAHKSYIILFDGDGPGRKGALQVAATLLDSGCRIDIASSPVDDVKQLTREDLENTLEKRQSFPAISLKGLPQKRRASWQ